MLPRRKECSTDDRLRQIKPKDVDSKVASPEKPVKAVSKSAEVAPKKRGRPPGTKASHCFLPDVKDR